MKHLSVVTLLLCMAAVVSLTGCNDATTTLGPAPSSTYPIFQPTGLITGKIFDRCTNVPIKNALLSVGVNDQVFRVSSDSSGSFAIKNLPATNFQVTGSGGQVVSGSYVLTASLVDYNHTKADAALRYYDYYYAPVNITFTSLTPGDSSGVSSMAADVEFALATLNTSVSGTVLDQTMQPVAGAAVQLFTPSTVTGAPIMRAQTTTDANGVYAFTNVENGSTISLRAMSSDGTLSGSLNYPLECNVLTYVLNPTDPNGQLVLKPLSTSLSGTLLDLNSQPVANAQVLLYYAFAPGTMQQQTRSGANGSFTFARVPNGVGLYIVATSGDGSLRGTLASASSPFWLPANVSSYTLNPQNPGERIVMTPLDTTSPYVVSISPEMNADVSPTGLTIVYAFSEPISRTAYSIPGPALSNISNDISLNFNGMKSLSVNALTLQWNATNDTLRITPQGLVASAKYTLDAHVAMGTNGSAKLFDLAGNPLGPNPNPNAPPDVFTNLLNFSTAGGSPVPAAPVLVRRLIPNKYNFLDVYGGLASLGWNLDPAVGTYNIYQKLGNGPFTLWRSGVQSVQAEINLGVPPSPAIPLFVGSWPDPLGPQSVSFEVTGLSKDLVEGPASNVITFSDEVRPATLWISNGHTNISIDSTSTAAKTNRVYYVTVPFSEPLATAAAQQNAGTNYVFGGTIAPLTVTKADYIGSGANSCWYVVLTASPLGALLPGVAAQPTLTVQNLVTDLNGNGVDATNGNNVYQFPILLYQGFENAWANNAPVGWGKWNKTGTVNWVQTQALGGAKQPAAPYAGSSVAQFPTSATPGVPADETYLESPPLNLKALTFNSPTLKFYYFNYDGSDNLLVQVSTDGGHSWIQAASFGPAGGNWVQRTVSLSGYANQTNVMIAFDAVVDHGPSDIFLDEVKITPP